jgi:hypothetical protein
MNRITATLLIFGLFISSCNLPAAEAANPQISTAAALTVQAALSAAPNTTALASPADTGSTSITLTPTFSQPIASVGDVTNCRTGPGANYERVIQILPNETVDIIGFYPPNYWIVSTKAGACWLSGLYATPSGSFAVVPTLTAPPTPEGGVPEAATFPKNGWTFFCYGTGQTDITLAWKDNATDELGYRVIRNGALIAELPANSTYFAETISLLSGQSVGYQIQAYNLSGETNSQVASMTCP